MRNGEWSDSRQLKVKILLAVLFHFLIFSSKQIPYVLYRFDGVVLHVLPMGAIRSSR